MYFHPWHPATELQRTGCNDTRFVAPHRSENYSAQKHTKLSDLITKSFPQEQFLDKNSSTNSYCTSTVIASTYPYLGNNLPIYCNLVFGTQTLVRIPEDKLVEKPFSFSVANQSRCWRNGRSIMVNQVLIKSQLWALWTTYYAINELFPLSSVIKPLHYIQLSTLNARVIVKRSA